MRSPGRGRVVAPVALLVVDWTTEWVEWTYDATRGPYSVRISPYSWSCSLAQEKIGWAWVAWSAP